jgi:hypothetical protein
MDENIIRKLGFQEKFFSEEKKNLISSLTLPKEAKSIAFETLFHKRNEKFSFEYDSFIDEDIEIFFGKGVNGKHILLFRVDFGQLQVLKNVNQIFEGDINLSEIGFVYLISSQFGVKIGCTNNIKERRRIFNVKLPFSWKFERIYATIEHKSFERKFHNFFRDKKISGEWFDLNEIDIQFCDRVFTSQLDSFYP